MKKLLIVLSLTVSGTASAHTGIASKANKAITPAFDIVKTQVHIDGPNLVFSQLVQGNAGKVKPDATGELAGSDVFSYVWPTTLDSSVVGFEQKQGILALVLTAHPDFDDTPRYDENNDGDKTNDGNLWHSHWVVLSKDKACGKNGLKVKDIPKGAKPRLPNTWPGLVVVKFYWKEFKPHLVIPFFSGRVLNNRVLNVIVYNYKNGCSAQLPVQRTHDS